MVSQFQAVADEFCTEVKVIQDLVHSFETTRVQPRLRTAASNSAMLLLAATFEDFVRNMADQVARAAVVQAGEVTNVPVRMLRTVWKRTFESIARIEIPQNTRTQDIRQVVSEAEGRSAAVFAFLRGKTDRDIYADLVQNDVNMRASEINRLFSMSGVSNVCMLVSQQQRVIDHFKADRADETSQDLVRFIDRFIEQRNSVAHALTSSQSVGASDVSKYSETFCIFAASLCTVLEQRFPVARRQRISPATIQA